MKLISYSLLAAGMLITAGCSREPKRVNEVVAIPAAAIPSAPGDSVWDRAPEHAAKLLLQDLVEPRLMEPSTTEVRVRAVRTPSQIAFRLDWNDATLDEMAKPGMFVDGCAIQLPKANNGQAPDPQMGQQGQTVEITFWRADWQAAVNGRAPTKIQDFYPNATIDHYPSEAKSLEPGSAKQKEMERLYSPARALGNLRSGPRESAVEEMIAEGPGTLSRAAASNNSKGNGTRTKTGWQVVISRAAPQGLAPRQRSQIAFAVWEGSHKEVGARKMRTGWIPLLLEESPK
ncbi:MAG: hypothetical protein FJW20_14855 [Acidimicrobiia bacterium]|nr:hypothetical protein [Acidimicrobiia bacterium]